MALAALALPSSAAAEALVPPGNSAVDQYTETYPTAGGKQATGKPTGGEDLTPAQILGPSKARRLEAQGEAGQAVAALAAATAPTSSDASAGRAPGATPGGPSGLGEILGQATGLSSTEGPTALLPFAILAIALWSLAYLWRRKRTAA
jgi:hypothetical protein